MSEEARGWVLVTGASSGIGQACATSLHGRGYSVLAAARRAGERLAAPAESGRWIAVELDVGCPESVRSAAEVVEARVGAAGLRGLVNSAGSAMFGPLEFLPLEVLREQLEINVIGTVAVTQAVLPALRRARGRVVSIGSISGRVVPPFLGPYAASKSALEAVSHALRRELRGSGVHVVLIEAGRVETPIWERSVAAFDAARARLPGEAEVAYGEVLRALRARGVRGGGIPASRVAERVIRCLEDAHPRARYVVGSDAKRRAMMRWLPDSLVDYLLTRKLPRSRM